MKIIALAHQEVERLPDERHEIEPGGIGDRAGGDAGIGAAGADRLRDIGTGRADRTDGDQRIERGFRPMQKREQQQLRAGALRAHGDTRALGDYVFDGTDLERIAGRQQQALLAAAERDHHRILQIAAAANGGDVGIGFRVFQGMQVQAGGDGLAGDEAVESGFAADRERGQPRAALAQRPFQQRVVAAADDRRRLRSGHAFGPRNAGGQPMVEIGLREQPAAGDLGAGHSALGHHFVDLAFLEAEIAGGFGGREELHGSPARLCIFFDIAKSCRKNKAVNGQGRAGECAKSR